MTATLREHLYRMVQFKFIDWRVLRAQGDFGMWNRQSVTVERER